MFKERMVSYHIHLYSQTLCFTEAILTMKGGY